MPQTGKPLFNGPTLQDTFENITDQVSDVGNELHNLVTNSDNSNSDGGIEQLTGQKINDPVKQTQQSQKQGLTLEQLMEKREEEKKAMDNQRKRIQEIQAEDEKQLQLSHKEEAAKQQAEEEKKRQEQQEIIELQQEQAKNTTLNPQKSGPQPGRGTAFMPVQTKQSMGSNELSKTPTN